MNSRPEFDISNIQTPKLWLIACGASNQAASCGVAKTHAKILPIYCCEHSTLENRSAGPGEFSVFDLGADLLGQHACRPPPF